MVKGPHISGRSHLSAPDSIRKRRVINVTNRHNQRLMASASGRSQESIQMGGKKPPNEWLSIRSCLSAKEVDGEAMVLYSPLEISV